MMFMYVHKVRLEWVTLVFLIYRYCPAFCCDAQPSASYLPRRGALKATTWKFSSGSSEPLGGLGVKMEVCGVWGYMGVNKPPKISQKLI